MYDPTKPYKYEILKLIESTWNTPYVKIKKGLYPIITEKISFPKIQHTDGIGTKGMYHWQARTFHNAVLDALAMNLNDLAMVGATPYALQNHIILPRDDHRAILDIIKTLAQECRRRNIAMTGGETSIHSDMSCMDISITVSGFIKSARKNQCKIGDVLIGLKSNGLHSNGITKVRDIFGKRHKKEFTKPTCIYEEVLFLLNRYKINGMMHITGGAFTKIKDILGKADAIFCQPEKLQPQPIFQQIYKTGVSDKMMYSIFNCGIGFVLSVPKNEAKKVIKHLKDAAIVGEIISGSGQVRITSAFSGRVITL